MYAYLKRLGYPVQRAETYEELHRTQFAVQKNVAADEEALRAPEDEASAARR